MKFVKPYAEIQKFNLEDIISSSASDPSETDPSETVARQEWIPYGVTCPPPAGDKSYSGIDDNCL